MTSRIILRWDPRIGSLNQLIKMLSLEKKPFPREYHVSGILNYQRSIDDGTFWDNTIESVIDPSLRKFSPPIDSHQAKEDMAFNRRLMNL